jgi:hypothetical protein
MASSISTPKKRACINSTQIVEGYSTGCTQICAHPVETHKNQQVTKQNWGCPVPLAAYIPIPLLAEHASGLLPFKEAGVSRLLHFEEACWAEFGTQRLGLLGSYVELLTARLGPPIESGHHAAEPRICVASLVFHRLRANLRANGGNCKNQ